MMIKKSSVQARFVQIKSALLDKIERGEMSPGDKVQSENQLAESFGVSRMTARRALTELVTEGILARSQGVGTFVSDSRPMSSILKIRSIDDEIIKRGHRYSNKVLAVETELASEQQSAWLGVATNSLVFHTKIVHMENGLAIQFEDRLVNPALAPQYIEQDFTQTTANHYLSRIAPLTEADHSVEAILPDQELALLLDIHIAQPCLKISRRTYSSKGVVSYARLYHPGNRYRIGGHLDFHPAQ
ncbi:histidine utilization repressor [Paraglaciecola arctica]|uniref:Histidine utilization repressor n=1 Tax=Paraglaciecola arctica BSs20135 TaxID=493475 RepID=K6YYJ9_9ALTE|nr:histidine utilization repressor [Paraglaciecola arctica]GAC21808.1 GntR family transcriptional regulator, histidine utilization repressor [Paraglaciecola arctica BSs20135]